MFRELAYDLRHGLRLAVRSPGFTAVALVTMALGIGANTSMFSIVNGVILTPLPYPEADRIVLLTESVPARGWQTFSVAPLNYWDWEEQNRSMELMAAYRNNSLTYTGGDQPQTVAATQATEDYLTILGGQPVLGRGITEEDLDPDAEAVVLLTHGFWLRAFGRDRDVLGRTMTLDGTVHTIVGVLPDGWRRPSRTQPEVILPLRPQPFWFTNRSSHFLYALARMRPEVSLEQARSDITAIAAALEAEYPESNAGWSATVRGLEDALLGSARGQLLIFMASVGLVLLIACANLANMTLARATGRARELAIRTAVGAGRGRVLRQLLAESVLLAVAGGALGVASSYLALEAFVAGWPTMLPRMEEIRIDGMVLAFSLALALASGVVFGLMPALNVAGPNIADSLRHGGRGLAGDRSRRWMRTGLVVAEVGLAVVLLVGTGLLVRSFSALQGEDPGFVKEGRLVLSTPLPRAKYNSPEAVFPFLDGALRHLRALPGAESVALTSLIPLEGSDQVWGYWLEENAVPGAQEDGNALFYRVSPGYFETMGIPLVAGRDLATDDRLGSAQVVVVSQSMAERDFPGENPLGRIIKFGRDADDLPVEIIGVVGDIQHYSLGRSSIPQLYVPFAQRPTGNVNFVVKSSVDPGTLVSGVREAIVAVDPDQPIMGMMPADVLIADSISMPRFRTLLMTTFGLAALLLAVVGLYGVMAYTVSQRTKEIGVRMALGASRGSVLGLVFRDGAPLVGLGLAIGLAGAFALSRILESMLFGVGARDLAVFAGVPAVLAVVALTAMLVPARRAARVDPVRTLGEE